MSAGATPDPPGESPAGPSAADFQRLQTAFDELRRDHETLRNARTEPQRQRARADVQESTEDLEATARRMGVSRESLERAISEARTAERREELRPIIEEILAEREAADPPGGDPGTGDGAGGDAPAAPPRRQRQPPAPPTPKGDDPPETAPHFTDRRVGELWRK